jgi:hypothetical protein
MYLPSDFPIVPMRLVVAQWKQYCGGDSLPCSDDSPVLAVRYMAWRLAPGRLSLIARGFSSFGPSVHLWQCQGFLEFGVMAEFSNLVA